MVDGTTDGLFLDDPRFNPIWETAVKLGVPVYLHPAPPPQAVKQAYFSGLPPCGRIPAFDRRLGLARGDRPAYAAAHLLRTV